MNNRNQSVMRPDNIPSEVRDRIVFVQPELKLSMDKSIQCEPLQSKKDAGCQTEANSSCPCCCLTQEEQLILKEVLSCDNLH